MTRPFLSPGKDPFAPRLALFYAALWLVMGIQLPFFPVWLLAEGVDSRTIGVLLAFPMLIRIVVIPIAGAADRHDAVRQAIMLTCAASALAYATVGLSRSLFAIFVTFAIASAAFAPTVPLADAYALRGLAEQGRSSYGRVRMWGSASFVLGNLGAGLLVDVLSARYLIWLIVAALVAAVGASLQLAPLRPGEAEESVAPAPGLLRNPALLLVIAAASVIQASHAVYYGFSTIEWRAAGLDGTTIAGLWALGVLAEITLFALSPRLRWSPTAMLMMSGVGGTIRWAAMAVDPPLAALPFLQCLHAFTFGTTHLGLLAFLLRAVPPGLGATVQAYNAIAQGVFMAAAMAAAGVLYADYGRHAYAAMAVLTLVGGLLAVLVRRLSPAGAA